MFKVGILEKLKVVCLIKFWKECYKSSQYEYMYYKEVKILKADSHKYLKIKSIKDVKSKIQALIFSKSAINVLRATLAFFHTYIGIN